MTTYAGTGSCSYGGDEGYAIDASLNNPVAIVLDPMGNLYINDYYNFRIRMVGWRWLRVQPMMMTSPFPPRQVTSSGLISTVVGSGSTGYCGDGGAATSACLSYPWGLAVSTVGDLLIADQNNYRIRKVRWSGFFLSSTSFSFSVIFAKSQVNSMGAISTVAGTGLSAYAGDEGLATSLPLRSPVGIAVSPVGDIVVSDSGANIVRKV